MGAPDETVGTPARRARGGPRGRAAAADRLVRAEVKRCQEQFPVMRSAEKPTARLRTRGFLRFGGNGVGHLASA